MMSRGSTEANMARDHNDEVAAAAIRALGDFGQEGATTLATLNGVQRGKELLIQTLWIDDKF